SFKFELMAEPALWSDAADGQLEKWGSQQRISIRGVQRRTRNRRWTVRCFEFIRASARTGTHQAREQNHPCDQIGMVPGVLWGCGSAWFGAHVHRVPAEAVASTQCHLIKAARRKSSS